MVVLDAREMTDRVKTHAYLQTKLSFPSHYGANLDALWDQLSSRSEAVHIILINYPALAENLGEYGERLLAVFHQAAETNTVLKFEMV